MPLLTGVEIIGPTELDQTVWDKLVRVGPTVVKVRRAAHAAGVLDLLPNVQLLTRPPGEGVDYGSMKDQFPELRNVVRSRGATARWIHLIANEPNHTSHHVDPTAWLRDAQRFVDEFGAPDTTFATPGLQRYQRIPEWRAVKGRLRGVAKHAGHGYWQDSPEAGLQDLLAQVPEGCDPADIIAAEFNVGDPVGPATYGESNRAPQCVHFVELCAAAGLGQAILFCLNHGDGWSNYVYSTESIRQILRPPTLSRLEALEPDEPAPTTTVRLTPQARQKMTELGARWLALAEPTVDSLGVARQLIKDLASREDYEVSWNWPIPGTDERDQTTYLAKFL